MSTETQIASHLLRARLGKICVALTGASAAEMLTRASSVLSESSFLEFRLDYLPDPAAAIPTLAAFLAANGAVTAIATCRCKDHGGRFKGSGAAALDILLKAATAGFQIVDLEIESAEKLAKATIDSLRQAGAAVIVSFHDFKGTPDLDSAYKRIEPFAPDFVKIVPTAKTLADNLQLLGFLGRIEDRSNGNVIAVCMGEPGILSRVLALRAGSAFTFAAASSGEVTAPGQLTARQLVETYRVESLDKSTRIYGVAGDPIRSSLSPLMLNTAFRRETVHAVYLALQTQSADDLFRVAREIPIHGLSVTMPLKQDVLKFLERTDTLSAKVGAVNTIARMPDGKFYGFNTDVQGILGPLERRLALRGARILVLGAGGAARAAVFACADKGALVSILNRTPETAQKLARQAGAKAIKREALAKSTFDVIINATPLGMASGKGSTPLETSEINARWVFDLVYNPIETPLLKLAKAKGCGVISGVEMFIAQGARQFEIWTGKPAPESDMLQVVLHALQLSATEPGPAAAPASPREAAPLAAPAPSSSAAQAKASEKSTPASPKSSAEAVSKSPLPKSAVKAAPAKKKPAPSNAAKGAKEAPAKRAAAKRGR